MIARVRGVMAASMAARSISNRSQSIETLTGTPPTRRMKEAIEEPGRRDVEHFVARIDHGLKRDRESGECAVRQDEVSGIERYPGLLAE